MISVRLRAGPFLRVVLRRSTGRRLSGLRRGAAARVVLAVTLVATAASLPSPPPAFGRDATTPEVRRLAASAVSGDRRALASLRGVDRVDGRAADLATALLGRGAPLQSRLRSLAEEAPRRTSDAGTARRTARGLLTDERYREPSIPRPLRGAFEWIGAALAPLVDAVGDAIGGLASLFPGGRSVGLTIIAGFVVLAFAAIASRTLRLRSRTRATAVARESARALGPSPAELERAAADAERAGDLSLAVRLRFRAGLSALERRGTISLRASHTTATIARRLDSREFAAVAAAFEEVAYGERDADSADVEIQRAGWRRVLAEVGA